jgi:hypothetical protein
VAAHWPGLGGHTAPRRGWQQKASNRGDGCKTASDAKTLLTASKVERTLSFALVTEATYCLTYLPFVSPIFLLAFDILSAALPFHIGTQNK